MKNSLKLISIAFVSGCTINVITSPTSQPIEASTPATSIEPIAPIKPEELPPNLRPENTGSNTATRIPIPTADTIVNIAPRPPIQTPTPIPNQTATPKPIATPEPLTVPKLIQNNTLEAPNSLKTVNIEANSITISWKASANADYYRVYLNGTVIGDQILSLEFTAQNLSTGQSYEFQVSAINLQGEESSKSKILNVGLF